MNERQVRVWYDYEGDFLEVGFGDRRRALVQPTEYDDVSVSVDKDGNVVGFMILNVTKLEGPPLDLTLKAPPATPKIVTTAVAAEDIGVSVRRLQKLLSDGRVKGAEKAGRDWLIPVPVEIIPGKRGPRGVAGERAETASQRPRRR